MTLKNPEGNNVLNFQRTADTVQTREAVKAELRTLLHIYERLIALLREADDDGLDYMADQMIICVVQCRRILEDKVAERMLRKKLTAMREELRQMPQTLRSLLPGIGPRLSESLECKLGVQFTQC